MLKIAPSVRGKDAGTCRAGSRVARAVPRRMPLPARSHCPRGGFCCRRAPPFALTGPQPLSSGQILLPSGLAVRPHRPATAVPGAGSAAAGACRMPHRPVPAVLGAVSAAAAPRRMPSPARSHHPRGGFCCRRAAPYVPSRRKPRQMLKRKIPDLDFAEKCGIFAKQRRKSYTTDGFLLF